MDAQLADQIKDGQRIVWAAGDFGSIAEIISEVGDTLVERVSVGRGDEVLDVACGTGNAALPAARTGARVTGLDIVPKLLDEARAAAEAERLEVEWVEGDAEALPFEDESFDVVLSTFGCMFAPRHEVAAAEIARVLRPGGQIGICAWTPGGSIGAFFKVVGTHMPAPPPEVQPPPLWGEERHVRDLFTGTGVEPEFTHDAARMRYESPEHALALYADKFGPVVMARQALEPQGKWDALREDLLDYYREHGERDDGGTTVWGEYLVVTGGKPA